MKYHPQFIKNILLSIHFLSIFSCFDSKADTVETEANKIFKQLKFAKSATNQSLPPSSIQPPMIPGPLPTATNAPSSLNPMVSVTTARPATLPPPQPQDIALSTEDEPLTPQKITLDADGSGIPDDLEDNLEAD